MSAPTAFGPITACPSCESVSSENYDGRGQCWPCYVAEHPAAAVEPERDDRLPEWGRFRRSVFDAMKRTTGHWNYIDADRVSGRCPICCSVLVVDFVGHTSAADFSCERGCDEGEIAAALFGKVAA